jgi:hypothetical protein
LIATHLPTEPSTLHAWHWPAHGDSQQTPSAHAPLPHSASDAQLAPSRLLHVPLRAPSAHDSPEAHAATPQQTPSVQNSSAAHGTAALHAFPRPGAGTHAPALQTNPAAQSAFAAQAARHVIAPQANAPQTRGTSLQRPRPSQLAAWVSTPDAHASLLHLVTPATGYSHALRLLPRQRTPQSPPMNSPTHAG